MASFVPKPRKLIEIDRELAQARKTKRLVLDEIVRLEAECEQAVRGYLTNLVELDDAIDDMLDLRVSASRLLEGVPGA